MMNKTSVFRLLFVIPFFIQAEIFIYSEPHLGTVAHILIDTYSKKNAKKLSNLAFSEIKRLDKILSHYKMDSELMILSQSKPKTSILLSEELFEILEYSNQFSEKTQGAFDIGLGAYSFNWRQEKYTSNRLNAKLESPIAHHNIVLNKKLRTILLKKANIKFDLGGVGKGYIADKVLALMKSKGIDKVAIIIGGEIVVGNPPQDKKGWKIGIESPNKKKLGSIYLKNQAISTSGSSYQFYKKQGKIYSHIINPFSKEPLNNTYNVTVLAPSGMQADAWATAASVIGYEKIKPLIDTHKNISILFSFSDHTLLQTEKFPTLLE